MYVFAYVCIYGCTFLLYVYIDFVLVFVISYADEKALERVPKLKTRGDNVAFVQSQATGESNVNGVKTAEKEREIKSKYAFGLS